MADMRTPIIYDFPPLQLPPTTPRSLLKQSACSQSPLECRIFPGLDNSPVIRTNFRKPDDTIREMHTPCQNPSEMESPLMLLARERLG
jgi:hypothetical protein